MRLRATARSFTQTARCQHCEWRAEGGFLLPRAAMHARRNEHRVECDQHAHFEFDYAESENRARQAIDSVLAAL